MRADSKTIEFLKFGSIVQHSINFELLNQIAKTQLSWNLPQHFLIFNHIFKTKKFTFENKNTLDLTRII